MLPAEKAGGFFHVARFHQTADAGGGDRLPARRDGGDRRASHAERSAEAGEVAGVGGSALSEAERLAAYGVGRAELFLQHVADELLSGEGAEVREILRDDKVRPGVAEKAEPGVVVSQKALAGAAGESPRHDPPAAGDGGGSAKKLPVTGVDAVKKAQYGDASGRKRIARSHIRETKDLHCSPGRQRPRYSLRRASISSSRSILQMLARAFL